MSLFTTRCVLVPSEFFTPSMEREILSQVATVPQDEEVSSVALQPENIVLVYSHKDNSDHPEQYRLLEVARTVSDHIRIIASYGENVVTLVVYEGCELRFCNAFEAVDFVTALYFIFTVLGNLQINIAASTLYFATPLSKEESIMALTYFKKVESI